MKVLVLAAGLGKRMKSKYPKVVHKIMGKEMINWVIDTASKIGSEIGVVAGHKADVVKKVIPSHVKVYIQKEQLGTAHAVMSAKEFIDPEQDLLILYGDVPFIKEETLKNMWKVHKNTDADVTILTAVMNDPAGYGRIIRDETGKFIKIIEEKDLTEEQKKIKEANMGFYIFKGEKLLEVLPKIKNDNAQKEYYLTDAPALLDKVSTYAIEDVFEVSGINTRKQLIELEKEMRMRIIEKLLDEGVTIIDPETTYIQPMVKIGKDTIIHPMTFIEGNTVIGEDCEIGPMTRIKDSTIGNRVKILRSEVYGATIEDDVSVGPFSRLREGAVLKKKVRVGNYVEVKKSTLEENVAAQHLSYIGDTFVGKNTNIGAGTITCNYDGEKKNPTFIEENVFIGSNTALVAPVRIGKDALIGAGSVITKDVPPGALALGRARQVNKKEWVYKRRKKK
ncbi:MAG: bifunctional UDP-N-acetylglucosamine diphosphorylase/glucosamine-1-phosphate N-acetyltransferase GlmU [Thermotogaceae bacterium]|nr:bifunctional UDP-N-acetylglucosamine diphosphorylase/glucosamine-1-phosphate N-acetyltransferase GlmU [Thermotogaceae bacterium]